MNFIQYHNSVLSLSGGSLFKSKVLISDMKVERISSAIKGRLNLIMRFNLKAFDCGKACRWQVFRNNYEASSKNDQLNNEYSCVRNT